MEAERVSVPPAHLHLPSLLLFLLFFPGPDLFRVRDDPDYYDLSKFYDHSYGSPYARAIGSSYVSELLARLTSTPVLLGGAINSTLDTSHTTFPLSSSSSSSGPTFYADFSHDNAMVPVLASLGIEAEHDLPSKPDPTCIPDHKFVVSKLVPFAGRFVFERLRDGKGRRFVRILVNDRVLPIPYPGCGSQGSSPFPFVLIILPC